VFTEAKDDGSGGDNWSYKSCEAPVKSSPPTKQHPVFLQGPDALPVTQPQHQSTESPKMIIADKTNCRSWLPSIKV